MSDGWDTFLDILGPELAAAAIAAGEIAPPPPPEVGEVIRSVFTTGTDTDGATAAASTDAA